MTHHSGGRNSEVALPLTMNGNRRTAKPHGRSAALAVRPSNRLIFAVVAMIWAWGFGFSVDAQPASRVGINDPDTYSVTPIPERSADHISRLKDLAPSRTRSSKIQRTSAEDDPEGAQTQTPFQLDQPITQV